ncbi:hypothetical protein [Cryobacterium sp. Y11]|uniref:hypothetical protein n=1 Tax=Cryobacterium sp. Y11 TaxID=2045016 RepID=UPI0018EC58F4|nr:hypothetical protein [Cryobacterium sp. Y11]
MSKHTELIAPLPDDARFDGYYFGFDPTGIGIVDAILSAVAVAGKGSHHTESWSEENDYYADGRPGLVGGTSGADTIQKNAERSAEVVRALLAEIASLKAAAESPTTPLDGHGTARLYDVRAYLEKTLDNIEDSAQGWTASDVRTFIRDALELAVENEPESPTTVEWGVQVGLYPDGSNYYQAASSEKEARGLKSRSAAKRTVTPWVVQS